MHTVKMDGPVVFKFATRVLGRALREAIEQAGLETEDIDLFVPHQANIRIIKSAARFAKLPEEKVFVNIHKYGNTSAASIPIALCEAFESGRAKIGDTLAFVAFGAGLTWASTVVKIAQHERPVPKRWWQRLIPKWFMRNGHQAQESLPDAVSEAGVELEQAERL